MLPIPVDVETRDLFLKSEKSYHTILVFFRKCFYRRFWVFSVKIHCLSNIMSIINQSPMLFSKIPF